MNNVYIMSATTVRQYCPEINVTIADVLINKNIIISQDTTLKNTMGHNWYNHLLLSVSGNTVSAADQYALDNWLYYILAYDVLKNLVVGLSFQLNEAGLRIKTSDHSTLAESKDIGWYRSYIDNFIDSKREEMYRYIRHKYNDYPYYFNNYAGDSPVRNIYDWTIKRI